MEPLDDPRPDLGSDVGSDPALGAAVDDAMIGDVLAGLPEAQPGRALTSATDFSSLYVRHRHGLAAHARRFLRDSRDVDEVVQETFLRLFLAISEIETELQAIAFARRTLTNLCIDRYRADRRRPTLITLEASPFADLASSEDDPDPVLQAEDAAIVREALARLSPLHRAALVKREIEEKALPQIAAELGVAEDSVKHLLFRARRALRRLLAGTSVEPGIDLTGWTDGLPPERSTSPLLRGATVFIFFLIGALVVATGIRPLFSGGGHGRPATDAVGRSPLNLTGPDALPPKSAPKPSHPRTGSKHRGASAPIQAVSTGPYSNVGTGGHVPAKSDHHPTTHAPLGVHAPRGHFRLSGPLTVTGAPDVAQGSVSQDGDSTVALSSFSAPTDQGFFQLVQSVKTSSTTGTSVAVTPSFVVGGSVQQPDLTGSTAAIATSPDGTLTVDVVVGVQHDSSTDAFPLTSLTAHLELTPDLKSVISEAVTLSTDPPDQAGESGGNNPPPAGDGDGSAGTGSTPGCPAGSAPDCPPADSPPGDTGGPSQPSSVIQ